MLTTDAKFLFLLLTIITAAAVIYAESEDARRQAEKVGAGLTIAAAVFVLFGGKQ